MMQNWVSRFILLGLILLVVVLVAPGAMVTDDGPVHLAFANLMASHNYPNHPLQERAYTINLRPSPNLAVYFLLDALIRATSPGTAESILQILAIVGQIAACYFAILMINPRNIWLATFILPLSLNQMLFLGLYNHSLSIAAFFLTIGCYFWMIKAPSFLRAVVLSGALVLTLLCHASGFIMAFAGIGSMSATFFVLTLLRGGDLRRALKLQRYSLVAMLIVLPVTYVFLSGGAKGNPVNYRVGFLSRLRQFLALRELGANREADLYIAGIISGILLLAFAIELTRVLRNRHGAISPRLGDEATATAVAALVSVMIMMIFPDTMGGGWTHFRRFELFPFFWGILLLAHDSFSIHVRSGLTAIGVLSGVILLISTATRQTMVRKQLAPLAEIDRLVGDHCTVLPVVTERRPLDSLGKPVWMTYDPYFQSASRLELTGDRVVLFNFLARLPAYPVHFRPNLEPQSNIFHWRPQQEDTGVKVIDIDGYQEESGMSVDYILLWGSPMKMPEGQSREVSKAIAHFDLLYRTADGSVSLYSQQRKNSLCVVPNSTTQTTFSVH